VVVRGHVFIDGYFYDPLYGPYPWWPRTACPYWYFPVSAGVTIDGQRWVTPDEGHFMVQVPAGKHRVEVKKPGYRQFTTEIEVGDGHTVPLNVSLMTTSS
jgi:hypothetical protein